MTDEFIKFEGKESGPTSVVIVGVHGDEKCGVIALKNILPDLKIDRGAVWFGFGNPRAIDANQRFVERNLNRMFCDYLLTPEDKNSYEYGRAQFIKTYLSQATALLDIHASPTPKSQPFTICEKNADGIVEFLPVNLRVSGFDKNEPGGTDYYMNKIGGVGICVECGFYNDPASAQRAEEAIITFLKARGHLPNDQVRNKQRQIDIYHLYKTKTSNFKLSRPFSDFEKINKGQLIGIDGGKAITAERDGIILFAQDCITPGSEAFLLGSYQ